MVIRQWQKVMDLLQTLDQQEILKAIQQREKKKAYDKEYKKRRRKAKQISPSSDSQSSGDQSCISTSTSVYEEPTGADYIPGQTESIYLINQQLHVTVQQLTEENMRLRQEAQKWYINNSDAYLNKFRSQN
jgi:hypothetical protein